MQNSLDQHWSAYYKKNADFRMITSRALTDILDSTNPDLEKKCLDIGCGTGQLTRELNHRGYTCVGIDASQTAIELARLSTTRGDELTYLQFNVEADDIGGLPSQSYSLITCKLVYVFIKDRVAFLERVDQLLMPGGVFAVITPVYHQVADATPISVDYDTTHRELSAKFDTVAALEDAGVATFLCRKR